MPSLAPTSAPLATLGTVTHIGTLDLADKGNQGPSYEGDGVSFSIHPDAWESIARLGGQPWWTADVSELKLIDGHALVEQHARALANWGVDEGWITSVSEFVVRWWDDESDETMEMVLPTRAAANTEAEDMEDATVLERKGWAPTAKLVERMRHSPRDVGRPKAKVIDDVATAWARQHGFAGVWWADDFAPSRLSAPRGVIFPEHVQAVGFVASTPGPALKKRSPRP